MLACVRGCVFVGVCLLNRSHERTALLVDWDLTPRHLLTFSTPLSHDIWKSEIRKEWSNCLYPPNTVLSPFLCVFQRYTGRDFGEVRKGTREVHGWYLEGFSGDLKRAKEGWIGYRVVVCVCVCVCVCVRACVRVRVRACARFYIYMGGQCCTYLLS